MERSTDEIDRAVAETGSMAEGGEEDETGSMGGTGAPESE
jgi:hypothetical protein